MSPSPGSSRKLQLEDAIERLPIAGALKRFVIPHDLRRIYFDGGSDCGPTEFAAGTLRKLGVHYEVTDADLARIPRSGPVVVVCNHPFGILEGVILFEMLSRVRPDTKILSNSLMATIPEMHGGLIFVDPFATRGSTHRNRRGVRETLSHLSGGGLLVVFPAGEVSHLRIGERKIADGVWNESIARFIRHSGATVLPIYFRGGNSIPFHLAGMIHPQLRTARLLHELINKERKTIELAVAGPIGHEMLSAFTNDRELTRYLRYRTYLMKHRNRRNAPALSGLLRSTLPPRRQVAIAPPAPVALMEREIARLPLLAESGNLAAYHAKAEEIPTALDEIGRLREITFRAVGEGTRNALDLDRFDRHYHHLFLWDRAERRIAGAYRLGVTTEILPEFGIRGLYTSTLFRFDRQFFERTGPAIEMGRSFVVAEYQKQYGSLLLLWKAIGAFVSRNPNHPILFGPVSISNDYHPVSRKLIVRYFQAQSAVEELARLVKPRRRFRPNLRGADNEAIGVMLRHTDELSAVTSDIESDGKGIPVLLKHYLKLGGKLLAFNVDPEFSHSLDGLIVVNLLETKPCLLQRYLGPDGARQFTGFHAAGEAGRNL